MFWNYLKIALRNLGKNKFYALINIVGLTVGLSIYLFSSLLAEYERTHDDFFTHSDRIYTVGSVYLPNIDTIRPQLSTTYSALGPVIEAELDDVEAVARSFAREQVVRQEEKSYYEDVTYADSSLLKIFDFSYIEGDSSALDSPKAVVLEKEAAIKYFGRTDIIGETLTLNNRHEFFVSAVIDIPQKSHFKAILGGSSLQILISLRGLEGIGSFRHEGDWNNLNSGNFTYVMLPPNSDATWLKTQVNALFERLDADAAKETIQEFSVAPLARAHLMLWDSFGFPILEALQILGLLILVTACINYVNLAVAQSLGRSREVGMRKVVGASRTQLLAQFLVESLVLVSLAMLVSAAILELMIPVFNSLTGRALQLSYLTALPWLLMTTLLVGLLAGIYPAILIARHSPIDALRDLSRKGKRGALIRSTMVGFQFAISALMLAVVLVMFAQNKSVELASQIFPKSEIYTLHRLGPNRRHLETLGQEIQALPQVQSVAFSSQVPYEQSNDTFRLSKQSGDEANAIRVNRLLITPQFFDVYDIALLSGRYLSGDFANDEMRRDSNSDKGSETINLVVNELALDRFGIASPEEAINQRLFPLGKSLGFKEAIIVGVVPTQNIQGLVSSSKPWVFIWNLNHSMIDTASIRLSSAPAMETVDDIEGAWNRVISDYPMNGRFLDESFNNSYRVMTDLNMAVAFLALVATLLAIMGLVGLTAYYAAQRTKEIGIRKALGASSNQIVGMLIWQFCKPACWALLLALPAAYFASNIYLGLFAERFESTILIVLIAGVATVILATLAVSVHAIMVARANPTVSLRYE